MGSPECGVQHVWGVAATASPEEAECGFVITVWGLVSNCLLGDHEAGGSVQHHVRVWTLCLLGGSLCYTALKGAGWRLWELCGAQSVQLNVVVLVLGLIMVVCCNSLSVDVLAAAGGLWWLLPPSPVSALQSYPSSSPFSPQPAARVYRCPPAVQGPGRGVLLLRWMGCIVLGKSLNLSGASISICEMRIRCLGCSFLYH